MNQLYILLSILFAVILISIILGRNRIMEHFDNGCRADAGIKLLDWTQFVGKWAPYQDPAQYKLRGDGTFYAPQGTPLPIADQAKPMLLQNNEAANVDGTEGAPKALSMFAYNYSSPECCYGNNGGYSTSGGCVCVTPQQRKWLASVGKNRAGGYVGID